ncbi:MAG: hypothetical protein ACTSX1_15770 [Candidatus Heimdallarchaeaceae archaeon]
MKQSDDEFIDEIKKLNSTLTEINETLLEIRAWYRQTPQEETSKLLSIILDSQKKLLVYHHSDGEKTTRDLAKLVGVGTGSVSRWWNEWIQKGIAIPIAKGVGNRAKKLFELTDYDIILPNVEQIGDDQNE